MSACSTEGRDISSSIVSNTNGTASRIKTPLLDASFSITCKFLYAVVDWWQRILITFDFLPAVRVLLSSATFSFFAFALRRFELTI